MYKFLKGYDSNLLTQVNKLIEENKLGDYLKSKYNMEKNLNNDKDLYNLGISIKNQYMKNVKTPDKIYFDNKIEFSNQALGLNSFIPKIQGKKIKIINDIKISSRFKKLPYEFTYNVLVHEIAHLKEKNHSKSFYMLCQNISPDYFQIDFDLRLYLTYNDIFKQILW